MYWIYKDRGSEYETSTIKFFKYKKGAGISLEGGLNISVFGFIF
jgi:hypothetical protein